MSSDAKKGTAVAKKATESKAMEVQLDENMLLEDAKEDLGFRKDDLAIPFLKVLQSNSPEVKKREPTYIEGAEEGMFLNSVTGQLWDGETGVLLVPVSFQRSWLEWRPLNAGGGLVKDWGTDDSLLQECTKDEKGKDITPAGNEFVQNALYYVLIVDPETGSFQQAAFSLKGTQLKKARKWNSLMANLRVNHNGVEIRPAPFYQSYQVSTIPESNDQGGWNGVKISYGPKVVELPRGGEIYMFAREFRGLVTEGKVKITPMQETVDEIDGNEAGDF